MKKSTIIPVYLNPEYLEPEKKRLPFSTNTSEYNQQKWEIFFKKIVNGTSKSMRAITSGCVATPVKELQPFKLVKQGVYKDFIYNKPQEFLKGLENAFQAIEDNFSYVQASLDKGIPLHVPFVNKSKTCLVAKVKKKDGNLIAVICQISISALCVTKGVILSPPAN